MIDPDNISITNLNRQLHAMCSTLGKSKVEVMKQRVLDINPNIIGKDIGDIIGTSKQNVTITDVKEAEEMLKKVNPDICIITTMSLMKDVKDALMLCAKLGINAITTCEEAFFPMNSSPKLTKEIDELAKKTNCTITGSGYQDAFWGT